MKKKKAVLILIAAAFAIVLLLVFSGGGEKVVPVPPSETTAPPAQRPLSPGYDTFSPFAGMWEGTWTNATFGSRGSVEATLAVNENGTASLTLDPGGLIFGLVDPEPASFFGTYDAARLTFQDTDELFGDFTVTIKPDGTFAMDAPRVSAAGVDRLEANGTMTEEALTAHYIVFFPGSSRAEGSVQLSRSDSE